MISRAETSRERRSCANSRALVKQSSLPINLAVWLDSRFFQTDRWRSGVLADLINVPQVGELQRPRTVAVGLFDVEQESLKNFSLVVGIADLQPYAVEFFSIDYFDAAVDSNRIVVARDEKYQANFGIALDVAVSVKEFVTRNIGDE